MGILRGHSRTNLVEKETFIMTQQQQQFLFDTVYEHLIKQGKPAKNVLDQCVYLTQDGLKCAVGCLIKPEYYSQKLEGCSVTSPIVQEALEDSLGMVLDDDSIELLSDLQAIHDECHNGKGDNSLKSLKNTPNLTITEKQIKKLRELYINYNEQQQ